MTTPNEERLVRSGGRARGRGLGDVTVASVARRLPIGCSALLGVALSGCGTVDPGADFQFAEVVFDANFFYCKVEPMLVQQKCGTGDPAKDTSGCHFSVTSFRLQDHTANDPLATCNGAVPTGNVSTVSQANWGAAEGKMATDPERAPLLRRPTQEDLHPRQIFPSKSPQADIIRQWATHYSSR